MKWKGKNMYLIAGLGNPTKEYDKTRHNAGFSVIDVLADRYRIDVSEKKHKALCGRGVIEGQKVLLLKPQTFMNLSGESIRAAADYYKIAPEEMIVIYDDISLEPGQLRIRLKGSAGGHNGIKNIIANLGTQDFPRIKVGVGAKPPRMDLADYVLSRFGAGEQKLMDEAFGEAAEAAVMMMTDGAERAMNHFNAKKKAE
jgi:PTH1 family peptidyl-tRNA hydrolase